MNYQRPTHGRLVHVGYGGKETTLITGLPFALLQHKKREYVERGYKKTELKIKYAKEL